MPPNMNPTFGPFENLDCITYSQMNLVNEMRYLWLQMVIWSRAYINNSVARQDALPVVYARLHSVPIGFYSYMSMFFGKEIAEQFIHLLTENIILFANMVNSMVEGNQRSAIKNQAALYENVSTIAVFMARISGSWNYNEWQNLLNNYLKMLIDEAVAILSGNYQKDIAIYDRLQFYSLRIADYLSKGVMHNLLGKTEDRY